MKPHFEKIITTNSGTPLKLLLEKESEDVIVLWIAKWELWDENVSPKSLVAKGRLYHLAGIPEIDFLGTEFTGEEEKLLRKIYGKNWKQLLAVDIYKAFTEMPVPPPTAEQIENAKQVLKRAGIQSFDLWCEEDVQEYAENHMEHMDAPDGFYKLTHEEALKVFESLDDITDATNPITWDIIEEQIRTHVEGKHTETWFNSLTQEKKEEVRITMFVETVGDLDFYYLYNTTTYQEEVKDKWEADNKG